ncbi:MAG: 3'-5' exonuclease domain-containing protein 2 [Muribaculaceae bacterium]|nr:3'-5' exonuclease domain-containing protein 2 [Muribaculaceae bacterium]
MTSIPKAELAELPAAVYGGKITIVDTPELLQQAVATLSKSKVLGFDTETKPSFKRGEHYSVSLLQLACDEECFLIRLNKVAVTEELKKLLENQDILKVGVSIHDDFHQLKKLFDMDPQGFVELQTYVKKYNIADNSLSRIYAIIFGNRISKGQRLTNWEASQLNEHQQEYAALDAVACLRIWYHLQAKGFDYKTSKYYREFEIPASQVPHN